VGGQVKGGRAVDFKYLMGGAERGVREGSRLGQGRVACVAACTLTRKPRLDGCPVYALAPEGWQVWIGGDLSQYAPIEKFLLRS
jgi:hypothetical protein